MGGYRFLLCLTLLLNVFHQLSDASGDIDPKLIAQACEASKGGQNCVKWLQDNENDAELSGMDKSSLNSIAFFAMKKIEKQSATVSEAVQWKLSNDSEELPPETQQGLSDCAEHYIPAVDLIEQAADSIAFKKYPDAITFLEDAMIDLDACQKSLAKLKPDPASGKISKPDRHAMMAINHRDILASHVAIAKTILELAAKSAAPPAAAAPPS